MEIKRKALFYDATSTLYNRGIKWEKKQRVREEKEMEKKEKGDNENGGGKKEKEK